MYEDAKSGKLVASTENEAETTEATSDETSKQENGDKEKATHEGKKETEEAEGDKTASGTHS